MPDNRLAIRPATVLISEDDWSSRLFPGELKTIEDYSRYSSRLRNAMGPHVVSLLKAGMSVVLDFPANTVANRRWMRTIVEDASAGHELHFLDVPDDTCKRRLRERNAAGEPQKRVPPHGHVLSGGFPWSVLPEPPGSVCPVLGG